MIEITKKVDGVFRKKFDKETSEVVTRTLPPIQKTQNHSRKGVLYDPFLRHTLENMSESSNFENHESESSWNGKHFKKLSGTRIQVGDEKHDFNGNIQNTISNRHPNLTKLSNGDELNFKKLKIS